MKKDNIYEKGLQYAYGIGLGILTVLLVYIDIVLLKALL